MIMSRFDFYYGVEADQFSFYRIPKELFTNEYFKNMSTDAKLLYGLMLDRMSLSRKNNWLDDENKVYIIYKVTEVQKSLNCSKSKAVALLKALDKYNLIMRFKREFGKADIIYVFNIFKQLEEENIDDDVEVSDSAAENENSVVSALKIQSKFDDGEDCTSARSKNQTTRSENYTTGFKNQTTRSENCTSRSKKHTSRYENQTHNKTNMSNINNNYINYSDNDCSCCYIPDIQDIENYIHNNNYSYNPVYFYNYYKANGWKLGGRPIQNFESLKAVMDNWQIREVKNSQVKIPAGKFNNYNQKIYSNEELEKIVRRKQERL